CVRSDEQWLMDPGVPETAGYLAALCREIAERYAVDGIHLDYIRYPERGVRFDDSRSYRRYGQGKPLAQWRRDNVTACVRSIHSAVKQVRPWVKLSCSPVGKYADLPRQSSRGWNARDAVAQDAVLWLREGLMDVLFPMMYFDGQHFYPFVLDWAERADARQVVPGLGVYFLHPREGKWELSAVERQMHFLRARGMGGYAMFRSQFLTDNVKGLLTWTRSFNHIPALPPAVSGAPGGAPPAPCVRRIAAGRSVILEWEAVEAPSRSPIYYNVYCRQPGGALFPLSLRQDSCTFRYRPALPALLHAEYVVTAIDAYGQESAVGPL
ncbi:MAG: family 10 glycosylhydrolase, partial [Alloprevotella sp.]|nr:family 10 glycosylhydrolase [Alloprevotella sp.]